VLSSYQQKTGIMITDEAEPPSAENPLFHMDQVVATPHSAGGVYDNLPNLVGHMFRNIQLFQRGLPIPEADLVVRRADVRPYLVTA
jgi:phosphoglycerate dehydrogenase-like enzyme